MISTNHITGLILAGGRAQRMGGIDKGLIALNKQPLIEIAIAKLVGQVGCMQINANRNLTQYATYGRFFRSLGRICSGIARLQNRIPGYRSLRHPAISFEPGRTSG